MMQGAKPALDRPGQATALDGSLRT